MQKGFFFVFFLFLLLFPVTSWILKPEAVPLGASQGGSFDHSAG